MYWWNMFKLAEDLREGRVDEKERFKYFVATFLAWTIAARVLFFPGPLNADTLLSAAVSLILAVAGIFYCYRINRSGDNIDFIVRMVCLSWPVAVLWAILFSGMLLIMLFFFGLHDAIFGPTTFFSAISELLVKIRNLFLEGPSTGIWLLILVYFSWMKQYLASVAKVKEKEDAHQWMKRKMSDGEIAVGLFALVWVH
jgi:hypothetical protein